MTRRWFILPLFVCLLGLSALPARAASRITSDTVVAVKNGQSRTMTGLITEDNYLFVEIQESGAKFKVPQFAVRRVVYKDSNYKKYEEGLDLFKSGAFGEAVQSFESSAKQMTRLNASQQKLFAQHPMYYAGRCFYEMKEYEKARKIFSKVLSIKLDTTYYFEAMFYEAKCYENEGNVSQAKTRYGACLRDFPAKLQQAKWNKPWLVRAALGLLRVEMTETVSQRGQENAVKDLLAKLDSLTSKNKEEFESPAVQTEAVEVRAKAFKYLKMYDKLVDILNRAIRMAQQEDNKETLQVLYIDRGDSYFGLMEKEENEKKQLDYARAALFDYLHLLIFDYDAKTAARANYHAGICFSKLKQEGWKDRAVERLKEASKLKQAPYSDKARELRREIESAKEG